MPRDSHLGKGAVEFNTELFNFETEVKREVLTKTKRLAEAALRRILELTPVDTHDTKNRWKVSLDDASFDDSPSTSALSDGLAVIRSAKYGQDIIINNNSVVAEILEYGLFVPADPGPSKDPRPERKGQILVRGGFSTQAPQGMVAVATAELEEFLE